VHITAFVSRLVFDLFATLSDRRNLTSRILPMCRAFLVVRTSWISVIKVQLYASVDMDVHDFEAAGWWPFFFA
jgi:hypothetical protein